MFRLALAVVGLLSLTISSRAQPLVDLMADVDRAQEFDYCQWRFDLGGDESGLPEVLAVVANDSTAVEAQRAAAILVEGGVTVAQASKDARACRKIMAKGSKTYAGRLKKATKSMKRRMGIEASDDPDIKTIQTTITDFWAKDQARRFAHINSQTADTVGAEYWTRRISAARAIQIDAQATQYIKDLLESWDWIDIHRFGKKVSAHAWILVQHADDHPDFQALALERMTPYLDTDGVSKSNYAYLWDRVAVNHGRMQRYGTQPTWECTPTGLVLAPLEDPDAVNGRRAEMGMDTVEHALAEMTRAVCK